jgi:hypothetical protein
MTKRVTTREKGQLPTDDQIRLKVLDLAEQGWPLFSLPGFGLEGDGHPVTPQRDTQRITRGLVEDGSLAVVGDSAGGSETLEMPAALSAVDADANWEPPGRDGVPVLFEVYLTDQGEALYWLLRAALEGSRAPT